MVNYKLELPDKTRLHPVFHVSLLEPAKGDAPAALETEIQPENELNVYDVEKIMGSHIKKGKLQYLVKWLGYEEADNT